MTVAFIVCATLTLISALVSGAYSVVGLRGADTASRVASMYALARSGTLVAVAIVGLISGNLGFEAAAAVAMILVQGFDAVIGTRIPDRLKTVGPAITALVNLAALVWLLT